MKIKLSGHQIAVLGWLIEDGGHGEWFNGRVIRSLWGLAKLGLVEITVLNEKRAWTKDAGTHRYSITPLGEKAHAALKG